MQKKILEYTALSVSIGIGPSKLLAKMAGEYRKPAGVTALGCEIRKNIDSNVVLQISDFLRDRPAAAIPGVGPRRNIHCQIQGWHTAFDIAAADDALLIKFFGRPGVEMKRELLGESVFPVAEDLRPPKSISRARSFSWQKNMAVIKAHLLRHLEYTILKMRRQNLACRSISLWLRDHDYQYRSAHYRLPQPANVEETIRPYVDQSFQGLYQSTSAYTQVGLALFDLVSDGGLQYSLFDDPRLVNRQEHVQEALDEVHTRFGRNAITRASALEVTSGTKRGLTVPLYE